MKAIKKHYPRIKTERRKSGYSQKQVAEMLSITQQQYQVYESGKREMPLQVIIFLADLLKVSLDYLTERVDDRQELYMTKVFAEEKAQLESRVAEIDKKLNLQLEGVV